MTCSFCGRRSTLDVSIVILRGRRSTLDVSCCVYFPNRIVRAASMVQLLYAPYFTLDTWHSTLHTLPHFTTLYHTLPHFTTLYTLHFTLHTRHFTLHTPHSTLHTLHLTLYTLHYTVVISEFTFSPMRSKGSRFTRGLRVCSLDFAQPSATVRNRP